MTISALGLALAGIVFVICVVRVSLGLCALPGLHRYERDWDKTRELFVVRCTRCVACHDVPAEVLRGR